MVTELSNEAQLKAHLAEHGNVSNVTLRGANLYGAHLYGAHLYGADLYGADLRGANLYGARNIVSVTGVGSAGRTVYFVNHADCIMVRAGCFWGTVDELLDKSSRENGVTSDHYAGYKAACEFAKIILAQHRVKYGQTESQT